MLHHVNWYTDTDVLKEPFLWDVTCQCVSGVQCSTDPLTCSEQLIGHITSTQKKKKLNPQTQQLMLDSWHASQKFLRHLHYSLCFKNHINKWPQNFKHCNHVQKYNSHKLACPQLNDLLDWQWCETGKCKGCHHFSSYISINTVHVLF
jgi:hypothetical protein